MPHSEHRDSLNDAGHAKNEKEKCRQFVCPLCHRIEQTKGGGMEKRKQDPYWPDVCNSIQSAPRSRANQPAAFGATVMLGFVVGLAISSHTFYSFVLENLRNLGALKAMGASDRVLARMVMLQTLTEGLIGYGYGSGVGLAMLIGMALLKKRIPGGTGE